MNFFNIIICWAEDKIWDIKWKIEDAIEEYRFNKTIQQTEEIEIKPKKKKAKKKSVKKNKKSV